MITGVVAIHTISTLFYILKKYIPSENIRELFYNLFEIIEIGSANKESILHALRNKTFPDFEDGLQYQCALEETVDCIITRNKKDFLGSTIPVYTPNEFLARFLLAAFSFPCYNFLCMRFTAQYRV